MGLFSGRAKPPKASVIINYEYWYCSYKKIYGITPNVGHWIDGLQKRYRVTSIKAFAAFAALDLMSEKAQLEQLGVQTIDTSNDASLRKNEATQFAVLDCLYQSFTGPLTPRDIILFTGSGCFAPVVEYLISKKKKRVYCYGVEMCFSKALQEAATTAITLPQFDEYYQQYFDWIINNLAYCVDNNLHPSFSSTIDAIVRRYGVQIATVREVLKKMITDGYVRQREHHFRFGQKARVVYADWERLIKEGLFDPEST